MVDITGLRENTSTGHQLAFPFVGMFRHLPSFACACGTSACECRVGSRSDGLSNSYRENFPRSQVCAEITSLLAGVDVSSPYGFHFLLARLCRDQVSAQGSIGMMSARISLLVGFCREMRSFCYALGLMRPRDPGLELSRVALSQNTLTAYGVPWFMLIIMFCYLSCALGLMRRVETIPQHCLAGHHVAWLCCMPRMKMEARAAGDARRGKQRRQREDGDGPGRVIEASVTVSVGGVDIDVTLLARMQDFLHKETYAGLCAVERGGIAFNLHF
ncbi:hypothetical protein L7F22_010295 [Adiantum nelumboides]|nr:hypothetical protein [Adiantum nelumboides]